MRNLSAEFNQIQNSNNRFFLRYADITLKDGTVLNLTNEHLWQNGIKFEDAVSGDSTFDIGSAIINRFTVSINNMDGDFTDYVYNGAEIVCYFGLKLSSGNVEKIRICTGTVMDCPYQNTTIINLTCEDNLRKFDEDYSTNLTYPATVLQMVQEACSACGVTLQTTSFANSDYVIQSAPVSDNLTYRQVLAWIAQICCSWCRCDEYGRLCFGWYDTTEGEGTSIVSTSGFTPNLDDVVITGVKVTEYIENTTEEQAASYTYGQTGYIIEISDNKLISKGTGETVAAMIGERISGMQFRPFTSQCLTDVSLEAGDKVTITDRNGKKYKSYLTAVTLQPGSYESIACNAQSAERKSAKQYSLIAQKLEENRKNVLHEKTEREKALEELSKRLSESNGVYTTIETLEDGSNIYYLHNKESLADSNMVWKMTAEAWAVSTDCGKTWNGGMTVDGDVIARILTTQGVSADWINTGVLTVKDDKGVIIFQADMTTGKVVISANSVFIGDTTVTDAVNDAQKTADDAMAAAALAKNMVMTLSNDFQTVAVDENGDYTTFPDVAITPTVMYGSEDISADCVYSITKSDNIAGSWDDTTRTYTVTALTVDDAWVDIKATYLSKLSITKRFTMTKLYAGAVGQGAYTHTKYSNDEGKTFTGNLLSTDIADWTAGRWMGNSQTTTSYKYRIFYNEKIPVKPNTKYIVRTRYAYVSVMRAYFGSDGKYTEAQTISHNSIGTMEFTTPSTAYYAAITLGLASGSDLGAETSMTYTKWTELFASGDVVPEFYEVGSVGEESGAYLGQYSDSEPQDSDLVEKYTWAKILGEPGRTYFLEPSCFAIKRGADNILSPSKVTFNAYYRDGTDANRAAINGRFVLQTTTDGSSWTTRYTGTADASTVSFTFKIGSSFSVSGTTVTITKAVSAIRCSLYADEERKILLDMQSVTVLVDIDSLTHDEIFNLLTNNGTVQGIYKEGNQIFINAAYIKSGTMVLGGSNNKYGLLEIRDENENVIGFWNKSGIYIKGIGTKEGYTDVEIDLSDGSVVTTGTYTYSDGTEYNQKTTISGGDIVVESKNPETVQYGYKTTIRGERIVMQNTTTMAQTDILCDGVGLYDGNKISHSLSAAELHNALFARGKIASTLTSLDGLTDPGMYNIAGNTLNITYRDGVWNGSSIPATNTAGWKCWGTLIVLPYYKMQILQCNSWNGGAPDMLIRHYTDSTNSWLPWTRLGSC